MKRLVVCCDGTWNKPDNVCITNIEKIARTVQTDPAAAGGCQQLVHYVEGVGVGYRLDRLLGGAFGSGLFNNVKTAYRFLALNYEPGDEIFAFGFSRGAYTARSLMGMIGMVGLLTRESLIADKLPEAVARYQRRGREGHAFGSSNEEFRRDFCHDEARLAFLGVFDTVGALGVPGYLPKDHQFHDIRLGDAVLCARQALAIDEERMTFEPCLWQVPGGRSETAPMGGEPRVKQVWFEGAHSDVGGGYAETGLSDTALLWMVREAEQQGLVFDEKLLDVYVGCGSSAVRHDSMTPAYRLLNRLRRLRSGDGGPGATFTGSRRNLDVDGAAEVRLASAALTHFTSTERDYRPANLDAYVHACGDALPGRVEQVVALP